MPACVRADCENTVQYHSLIRMSYFERHTRTRTSTHAGKNQTTGWHKMQMNVIVNVLRSPAEAKLLLEASSRAGIYGCVVIHE